MRTTAIRKRALRGFGQLTKAFAVSELILTTTTATVVIGTSLTSLTIYLGSTDERHNVVVDDVSIAALPAEELSMEATFFHLELQELTHEADLCYVIGGNRCVPGSESAADFVYNPPLDSSSLRILDVLEDIAHAPGRALSSHVITQLLEADAPSTFGDTSESLAAYQAREFTILTVSSDQTVTGVITHRVTPSGDWVILESTIYQPSGNAWAVSRQYSCAASKDEFDGLSGAISIGAAHYWTRHDRTNPVASESGNSLWNRYEECFCRVEFPDHAWNLSTHPAGTAVNSRFTYFLPVVK